MKLIFSAHLLNVQLCNRHKRTLAPTVEEVNIKDKSLFDKVRLIDDLPEEEKNIVIKVIDLALSKKKFKDFFQQQLTIS